MLISAFEISETGPQLQSIHQLFIFFILSYKPHVPIAPFYIKCKIQNLVSQSLLSGFSNAYCETVAMGFLQPHNACRYSEQQYLMLFSCPDHIEALLYGRTTPALLSGSPLTCFARGMMAQ